MGILKDAFKSIRYVGFFDAAFSDDTKKLQQYLNKGFNINKQDSNGWTAAMWASARGNDKTVKLLARAGADFTLKNKINETAFSYMNFKDKTEIKDIIKQSKKTLKNKNQTTLNLLN